MSLIRTWLHVAKMKKMTPFSYSHNRSIDRNLKGLWRRCVYDLKCGGCHQSRLDCVLQKPSWASIFVIRKKEEQFVTMILLQTTKKKKKQKKYTHEWSQIAENSFFPQEMGIRRRLNLLSLWEVGSQLWRIFSKRSKSFKMKLVVWRTRRRKGRRDILLHRHSHHQSGTSPRIDSNIPQERCPHVRPEDLTILFSSPRNLHYHIHHVRLTSRQKTLFSHSSLFCHMNFTMCTYENSRPNSNENEKNLFVL